MIEYCNQLWGRGVEFAHSLFIVNPPGFLAVSRNTLVAKTAREYSKVTLSNLDQKVLETVQKLHLTLPERTKPLKPTDHSAAMSLKFLQRLVETDNIITAAKAMTHGADLTCAQGTLLYRTLTKANPSDTQSFDIKKILAQHFNLLFNRVVSMHIPANDVHLYLRSELEPGKYLMVLPDQWLALVKQEDNTLWLYDPKQGTYKLASQDDPWFLRQLVHYKEHLTEKMTLFRVQDAKEPLPTVEKWSVTTEDTREEPEVTFENAEGEWGFAIVKWRGYTYRFVRNNKTHEVFNEDPQWLIRSKCTLLNPGTVLATTARMISHLAHGVFYLLSAQFCAEEKKRQKTLDKAKKAFIDIFRAPLYGLLGIGAALYGILRPYHGRSYYGHFERCLNRQAEHVDRKASYFMAPCFVPLNFNAADRASREQTIAQLKKTILWREYFFKELNGEL